MAFTGFSDVSEFPPLSDPANYQSGSFQWSSDMVIFSQEMQTFINEFNNTSVGVDVLGTVSFSGANPDGAITEPGADAAVGSYYAMSETAPATAVVGRQNDQDADASQEYNNSEIVDPNGTYTVNVDVESGTFPEDFGTVNSYDVGLLFFDSSSSHLNSEPVASRQTTIGKRSWDVSVSGMDDLEIGSRIQVIIYARGTMGWPSQDADIDIRVGSSDSALIAPWGVDSATLSGDVDIGGIAASGTMGAIASMTGSLSIGGVSFATIDSDDIPIRATIAGIWKSAPEVTATWTATPDESGVWYEFTQSATWKAHQVGGVMRTHQQDGEWRVPAVEGEWQAPTVTGSWKDTE